jgi:hypothetical protein
MSVAMIQCKTTGNEVALLGGRMGGGDKSKELGHFYSTESSDRANYCSRESLLNVFQHFISVIFLCTFFELSKLRYC